MPNTYNSSHTGAEHDTYVLKIDLINLIYPVGSIYMSMNSTSPATLFGGTWEQIQGKFLLSADTTYTAGSSGGSTTSGGPSTNTSGGPSTNTSGSTAITIDQMPSHTHRISYRTKVVASGTAGNWIIDPGTAGTWITSNATNEATGGGGGHTHTLSSHTHTLSSHTHSVIPPYLAVYMWQRTA